MSIDVKELRIGNLYYRKHGKGWTQTVIDEEIICKIFSDNKEYAIDDFEPIPLTVEELMEYGFTKLKGYIFSYIIRDKNFPEDEMAAVGNFAISFNKNNCQLTGGYNNIETDIGLPFQYFHQLQNLYFILTSEELVINL